MKITIHPPVGFNETGGRSNNEDSIYPPTGTATVSDQLFLVCDGVGGEHRGEVASALACSSLRQFFSELPETDITVESVTMALKYTTEAFERQEKQDSGTKGMATTLTLLSLQNNGIAVAHLGDSRIYQVRHGKIIFKSRDHKWVNELIESGVITEQQAKEHPKRNVITRVISAGRNDEAEFRLIEDVRPGDYFFMCTDGVLEQLYDELLEYHLRNNADNEFSLAEILDAVKEECEGKTNDNFSAYLIKVATVENAVAVFEKTFSKTAVVVDEKTEHPKTTEAKPGQFLYTIVLLVIGILLFGSGYYYFKKSGNSQLPTVAMPIEEDEKPTQADTVEKPKENPVKMEVPVKKNPELKQAAKAEQKLKVKENPKPLEPAKAGKKTPSKDTLKQVLDTFPVKDATNKADQKEQKPESPAPESTIKSEKSDLPEKLKKVDPKPVE